MKKRTNKRYGWNPDLPDHRDFIYAPSIKPVDLVSKVDLRSLCPPIYDQLQLGDCTGNGIAGEIEFELKKQFKDFMPSRLFIYYNERVIEGTVRTDSGAQIRDGMKSVAQQGVCTETMWPYVISTFTKKPTAACYKNALTHLVTIYTRVTQDLTHLKSCLTEGFPFVFGFTVYESFESNAVAETGIVPMPSKKESVLGGHCVMCVGFDDSTQRFLCRNSWGTDWGMAGYFTIPYAYLTNSGLSSDFWTIRMVKS